MAELRIYATLHHRDNNIKSYHIDYVNEEMIFLRSYYSYSYLFLFFFMFIIS